MIMNFDEIKEPLRKILEAFHKNRKLFAGYWKTSFDDTSITIQNIIDLSCNHLFDDHPERFGIKYIEAKKIRSFIHMDSDMFKKEMLKTFSDLLEEK